MTKNQQKIQLSLLLALAVVSTLVYLFMSTTERPTEGVGGADGILGGEFELQSSEGLVRLSDFQGKVTVVYFGFLSCPEVCPASMGMVSKMLNKLSEAEQLQVQPILISIDPKRDEVQEIAEFTHYFHPSILGVTGSPEQIDQVALDYGAFFEVSESVTPGSDYAFRHSSRYYVIDQNGQLVDAMRHSTTANELAARIRTLI